jgi:transposase
MGKLRLATVELTAPDRAKLESYASRPKTAQALALRARIVLGCASGLPNKDAAAQLGVAPNTVSKWRRRFLADGMGGLRDEPRSGAPRTVDDARIEAVIVRTLESQPSDATHWSSRSTARTSGLSTSTVQRIWRAFGLQPHREGTFKISTDPDFVDKVRNVVNVARLMDDPGISRAQANRCVHKLTNLA